MLCVIGGRELLFALRTGWEDDPLVGNSWSVVREKTCLNWWGDSDRCDAQRGRRDGLRWALFKIEENEIFAAGAGADAAKEAADSNLVSNQFLLTCSSNYRWCICHFWSSIFFSFCTVLTSTSVTLGLTASKTRWTSIVSWAAPLKFKYQYLFNIDTSA